MAGTAQRNMAFGQVNAFVVVVHNKHSPTDEEWSEYLQTVHVLGIDHGTLTRYLILTEGGAPTFAQRKALNNTLLLVRSRHPTALQTAIVTPSTFVRGVVKALSQLHPVYRVFAPQDMHAAYACLGIPPAYFDEVEALIRSLKAELRP